MACKNILRLVTIFLVMGCAPVSREQKQLYEQGYRVGIKEQIRSIAAEFQGGNFPYYHWAAPIVQEVEIPGHVANGVLIPMHKELVIIKPGEWSIGPAYPIESTKEIYEHATDDNALASSDITYLPGGKGKSGNTKDTRKSEDIARRVVGAK